MRLGEPPKHETSVTSTVYGLVITRPQLAETLKAVDEKPWDARDNPT
jgi:hypothetical protein